MTTQTSSTVELRSAVQNMIDWGNTAHFNPTIKNVDNLLDWIQFGAAELEIDLCDSKGSVHLCRGDADAPWVFALSHPNPEKWQFMLMVQKLDVSSEGLPTPAGIDNGF